MPLATSALPKIKENMSGKSKSEWEERRSSLIIVKIVYHNSF